MIMGKQRTGGSYEVLQKTLYQTGGLLYGAVRGIARGAQRLLASRSAPVRRRLPGETEVDRALRELGEMLYGTHTGNPTESSVLLTKLEEIDALKAHASEEALRSPLIIEAEYTASEPNHTTPPACPHCGKKTAPHARFCMYCGKPLSAHSGNN